MDTDKIKADMQDGVLSITVPKAEVAKPRHVEISETSENTESSG
ncbi:Hsp20/alpha crystallin family protein [Streptomyces avermitilis]